MFIKTEAGVVGLWIPAQPFTIYVTFVHVLKLCVSDTSHLKNRENKPSHKLLCGFNMLMHFRGGVRHTVIPTSCSLLLTGSDLQKGRVCPGLSGPIQNEELLLSKAWMMILQTNCSASESGVLRWETVVEYVLLCHQEAVPDMWWTQQCSVGLQGQTNGKVFAHLEERWRSQCPCFLQYNCETLKYKIY